MSLPTNPAPQPFAAQVAEKVSSFGLPVLVVAVSAYAGGSIGAGWSWGMEALLVFAVAAVVFALFSQLVASVLALKPPANPPAEDPLSARGMAKVLVLVGGLCVILVGTAIWTAVAGALVYSIALLGSTAAVLACAALAGILALRRGQLAPPPAEVPAAPLPDGTDTPTPPTPEGHGPHTTEEAAVAPGSDPDTGRIIMPDTFRLTGPKPEEDPPKPVQDYYPDTDDDDDEEETNHG